MADAQTWAALIQEAERASEAQDYTRAEEAYGAAILVAGAGGQVNWRLARTLFFLGAALKRQGRVAEAELQLERAVRALELSFGPDDVEVTPALHNLAFLKAERGDLRGALALHQRAWTQRTRKLGRYHPDTATSLHHTGLLLAQLQDSAAASECLEQSLEIRTHACGPRHPHTGDSLQALGNLWCETGRVEEAAPLFEKAMDIFARHPEGAAYAACVASYVATLRRLGRRDEVREALLARLESGDPPSPGEEALRADTVLLYETGQETEPEGRGYVRLQLSGDGHVFLCSRSLATLRSWSGTTQEPRVLDLIETELCRGGFPHAPALPSSLADARLRVVGLHHRHQHALARMTWEDGLSRPGYRRAFSLLDNLVRELSGLPLVQTFEDQPPLLAAATSLQAG